MRLDVTGLSAQRRRTAQIERKPPASPHYNLVVSTLEERMEDFAPVVVVMRDGVEVRIPMDEFWAMQEKEDPDEAPA